MLDTDIVFLLLVPFACISRLIAIALEMPLRIGIIYVIYCIYSYSKRKRIVIEEKTQHKRKKGSTTHIQDSEMAVAVPAIIIILIFGWVILGPFQAMYL